MTKLVSLNHLEWILRCIFPLQKAHNHISLTSTKGGGLGSNFRIVQAFYSSLSDFLRQKILVRLNYHVLKLAFLYLQIARLDWESASPSLPSSAHHPSSSRAFHLDPGIFIWKLGTCSLHLHKVNKSHPINSQRLFCFATEHLPLPFPKTSIKISLPFISIKIWNFRRQDKQQQKNRIPFVTQEINPVLQLHKVNESLIYESCAIPGKFVLTQS